AAMKPARTSASMDNLPKPRRAGHPNPPPDISGRELGEVVAAVNSATIQRQLSRLRKGLRTRESLRADRMVGAVPAKPSCRLHNGCSKSVQLFDFLRFGGPGRTGTSDLQLRRLLLYPAELRGRAPGIAHFRVQQVTATSGRAG